MSVLKERSSPWHTTAKLRGNGGGSMESDASIGTTGSWASIADNAAGRPTVNAEDGSAVSAEVCATVKVEAGATVKVEAGATVNAAGRSAVKVGDRATVNAGAWVTAKPEGRASASADNRSAVNAVDRATAIAKERADVNAEDWVTAKAEDRETVSAEDPKYLSVNNCSAVNAKGRATANGKEHPTANGKERATVNAGAWVTAKPEDRAAASADDRPAVSAEARATANAKESAYGNAEAWVTAKVEDRAGVSAEGRAAVSAEARSADSAEARAAANAKESACGNVEAWVAAKVEDRAEVSAEGRAAVSAEGHAAADAKESAYGNAEAWLSAKVEDRAEDSAEGRAAVSAEARSADSAEARAAADAEERASVNTEAWVTAKVEDRAAVGAEGRAAVSAEARSAANALDRVIADAEERATANAEARGTSFVDNHAAVSAEARSAVRSTSHLARSRALFRGLDDTRSERRNYARALTSMDPELKPLEIAIRKVRELARLPGMQKLPNTHSNEWKQRIFDKALAICKDVDNFRMPVLTGVCADGVGVPVPTRGELELLTWSDVTRMGHQEMLREVGRLNRAKRIAVRVVHRRARQAALGLKKVNMELRAAKGGQGTRTLGGPIPAEPIAEGLRAGRQDAKALEKVEIGRINRAKRAVACAIKRRRKRAAWERAKLRASKFILEQNEAHEAQARPSCRKAACQEGIISTREHGHARNLSDRCHSREMKEASWGDGGVGVEIRVDEGRGRRITADEASTTRERTLTNGRGNVDGMEAGGEELRPEEVARWSCLGTGEVNGKKTAAVDGTGAGESPAVEAMHKELREKAIVEVAGEFPVVDAMHEELRAKAIMKAAKRLARDAVEVERKAERARARHAEKARWRAEKQQKLERRASRDARRRKKLQDRESRAQLNGENLRPPVERMGEPPRLERDVAERRGGMLAQQDAQDGVHAAAAAAAAAAAGPLAGVGKRSTATCAAADFVPESSVRIGLGEVGMSAQRTAPRFQALTRSQPGAASGDTAEEKASRFAATISGGGRIRDLAMGSGGGRGGIKSEAVETDQQIRRFRTSPNGQHDSLGPTPSRLGALPQFYSR